MGQRGRARASNIEQLEKEGKIVVIRPQKPIEVSRMEKDTQKLSALYQEGYDIAKDMIRKPINAMFYRLSCISSSLIISPIA